ncbi:unnamed protein product [Rotaria sordida]|uniref:Uncharacterized protein n=1 Tax=Rotaria sordida TaxID=392033 RepID=A0A815TDC7_9BILA|nr:unnamed protein product [Rotaria sordida]CAF1501544.1 unnamed protein product [Rotaria sordida]
MASYYEMTNFQASMTVQQQPQEIKNVFGINSGEHILKTYECDETCCGCGDKYTVTLTNTRLIQRRKSKSCCCSCGRIDSMLFLSDISTVDYGARSCLNLLCSYGCSFLCLIYCCACCCNIGAPISFRGGYGEQMFTFNRKDLADALVDVPNAATPQKASCNNYLNAPSPSAPIATKPKKKKK